MSSTETYRQLQERSQDQIRRLWDGSGEGEKVLFLTSSSDMGVARNGGRRGARFAPQAILHVLGKMALHPRKIPLPHVRQVEVARPKLEAEDFALSQEESSRAISQALEEFTPALTVHLGGGHDHILPLLLALKDCPSLHVINIDAHLDTRTDAAPHSGTPFRQFAERFGGDLRLTQIGIQDFANAPSNYQKIKGEMTVLTRGELSRMSDNFRQSLAPKWAKLIPIKKGELTLLSLDCDALEASAMEAVSAVNQAGLPLSVVEEIFEYYHQAPLAHKIYGFYEYNPIHDNLSQKGARLLAGLLYALLP